MALLKPSNLSDLRRSSWWYPTQLCTFFIVIATFIAVAQPAFWLRITLWALFLIYVIVSFVKERERVTQELQRLHDLQSMAERLGGLGSWKYNTETDEFVCSTTASALFGLGRGGLSFSDLIERIHPEDRASVLREKEAVMTDGRFSCIEYRIERPHDGARLMRAYTYRDNNGGNLFGHVVHITHAKPNEERQALIERMETAAVLAGGLSHDFNNLLQVMLINLELAREEVASEDQAHLLDDAIATTIEAADLVARLKDFAAPEDLVSTESIVLDDLIEEALPTLRRAVPEDLHLVSRLNASSVYVSGSRSRVRQLVMNLVFNARDATEKAGEITVETRLVQDAGPTGDATVHLRVSDTGRGIGEVTQRHIFEPFFSTKPRGTTRGTGLGLAICYRTVADMGGSIEVESGWGQGATFHVSLPMHQRNTDDEDGS